MLWVGVVYNHPWLFHGSLNMASRSTGEFQFPNWAPYSGYLVALRGDFTEQEEGYLRLKSLYSSVRPTDGIENKKR